MFEYQKGMICIMETGISQKNAGEDKTTVLEQGTPVRVVEIVEPVCSSMIAGECQAPCKGACCPRTIIVEDCNGKQWTVEPDIEDGDFPLIVLDDGDAEMLLARKDWKKFKIAKWTGEGIESKFKGSLYVMVGVLCVSASKDVSGPWGIVMSVVCGLIAIYGATLFAVGNTYTLKPLPYGQMLFYRDYKKNKEALELLLQKRE